MQQAFIEKIKINKVRHLQNINVPICKEKVNILYLLEKMAVVRQVFLMRFQHF